MTGRRRPHWRPFVLVLFLSLSLAPLPGATPSAAPSAAPAGTPAATTGRLEARVVLVAGALSERFRNGVFKIVTDGGHGTGFLVSEDGLILTNHHVIADATFLAAKLDDRHKHQVVVVTEDAPHDVAVLRIHPDTVRG